MSCDGVIRHLPAGPLSGGFGTGILSSVEGPAAEKILRHLGWPTELPAPAPARVQRELWDTGPPRDEHSQAPAPDDFDQRWAESEVE